MKKLLLIAAASATILSSTLSFADGMDDNQWYLKANAGASIFNKAKIEGQKLKSNTAFVGEIGAGYYIMDNVRADITLGMVSNAQFKLKTPYVYANGDTINSVKVKPNITSLLINGYVDFVDVGMFKVFGGAGIGAASVKEKVSSTYIIRGNQINLSASGKRKTNFTYQLSLGASAEVADGVKAELVYSWRDYGKAKDSVIRYKGNNLMAGIRFDI